MYIGNEKGIKELGRKQRQNSMAAKPDSVLATGQSVAAVHDFYMRHRNDKRHPGG
jgi:hypothetical protein